MKRRALKIEEKNIHTKELIKEKRMRGLEHTKPTEKAVRMFRYKPYGSMDETIDQGGK